jgi:NADPH:quinone reductase-like Zn-dependent oxidoreductase
MDPTTDAPDGTLGQPPRVGRTMTAMVQDRYGAPRDVLRLARIPVPRVGEDEVLIQVKASSANPWDWHFIRGEPVLMRPAGIGGVRRPKFRIPGGDVAGIVEQAGAHVHGFACGDEVFGFGHGAFAQYVAVPQGGIAVKPKNLSFEQAAAVPLGAVTALQGLRAGNLRAGQRVLIIGASGGVGTFAVQIAKHLGARVTGVCSTRHVDLVRRLGAQEVLDYTERDITAGSERYDLVLQLGGTYTPAAIRRVLTRRGTLIQSYGDGGRWLGPLFSLLMAVVVSPFVSQTLKSFTAQETTRTLDEIRELVEAGHLTPVIDSSYPLAEAAAAVQRVEQGSPGGKITVIVE